MLILLIIILLVLFGSGGWYGSTRGYYGQSQFGGVFGIVVLIVLFLAVMGRLQRTRRSSGRRRQAQCARRSPCSLHASQDCPMSSDASGGFVLWFQ